MRNEQQMFDLILKVAKEDEAIRSVIMVGSRANSECPKDIYQDYDITYFVTDIKLYFNNLEWIKEKFGEPAVVQLPENMSHPLLPPDNDGHFTYLMIFEDGNRIDLSIEYKPYVDDGEPAIVLLDKDNTVSIEVNQSFYHIKPPKLEYFKDACNNFWWCLNNVAKGIARDELPYVMEMFHHYVRDMLNQMVEWYIGMNTGFSVSAGKMGKYYKKYLSAELYEKYEKTYSNSNYQNVWSAVFTACELFRELAQKVAEHFGYEYNEKEDTNMMKYLYLVKNRILEENVHNTRQ